jgi:putative transposase
MAVGRPMPPLVLAEDEVQQLQSIANSRSLPHSIVQRAQIVLACGAGETNTSIAKRMGLTGMTVGKWRKRYLELGLEGLHDELRPGRPRTYEDDTVAEVINRALQTKPPDCSTHWSARSLAAATGISLARRASACGRPPFTAGCRPFRCSLTGRRLSSSRVTPSSLRR